MCETSSTFRNCAGPFHLSVLWSPTKLYSPVGRYMQFECQYLWKVGLKYKVEVPVWPGLHTWPWQPLHNQGDLPGCRVNSKWKKWISCLADGKLVQIYSSDEMRSSRGFVHKYDRHYNWIWPSSSMLMSDFTCQTQSLRFEQSGQRFEWQARQGWRWRSWKRRGCSCQPPCWQEPHNHVLYDPASLLSLSFCSTPAQLPTMAIGHNVSFFPAGL